LWFSICAATLEEEFVEIAAGRLDGTIDTTSTKHIYLEMALQWGKVSDALPQLIFEKLTRFKKSI
jgi:hypothetical protein